MTFNPPPNWPTPPVGWNPEPGWEPDPSWPKPPDGWRLWVDETRVHDATVAQQAVSDSSYRPSGPIPQRITSRTIVLAVVVVLAAIAGAAYYVVQSLKPHEFAIHYNVSWEGSQLGGTMYYGLDGKTNSKPASSNGNATFDARETFTGDKRNATLRIATSGLEGVMTCEIVQDGHSVNSNRVENKRYGPAELTCSAIVG